MVRVYEPEREDHEFNPRSGNFFLLLTEVVRTLSLGTRATRTSLYKYNILKVVFIADLQILTLLR